MTSQTSSMFPRITQALDRLAAEPSCKNVGELQMVVCQHMETVAPSLEPLHAAVTSLFVSSRLAYLESLSKDDFFALVQKLRPAMLERQLLEDCDRDGNPVYEGRTTPPALQVGQVTPQARQLFLEKAGLELVQLASVKAEEVCALHELYTGLVKENDADLRERIEQAAEEAARSAPRSMYIPRF